jgi:hypothetical protein
MLAAAGAGAAAGQGAVAAAATRGDIGPHFSMIARECRRFLCGLHITCFRFAVAASLGAYPRFIFITMLWFALDKREAPSAPDSAIRPALALRFSIPKPFTVHKHAVRKP